MVQVLFFQPRRRTGKMPPLASIVLPEPIRRETMTVIRRRFLSLAGAALAASAGSRLAWSQGYPNRQIRVVVMLAAGGGTDFLARLTGEYISRGLGQQIVVENRTGAGGTIGI
jgi:hypothetical protein